MADLEDISQVPEALRFTTKPPEELPVVKFMINDTMCEARRPSKPLMMLMGSLGSGLAHDDDRLFLIMTFVHKMFDRAGVNALFELDDETEFVKILGGVAAHFGDDVTVLLTPVEEDDKPVPANRAARRK
jgi:hypothetical protein